MGVVVLDGCCDGFDMVSVSASLHDNLHESISKHWILYLLIIQTEANKCRQSVISVVIYHSSVSGESEESFSSSSSSQES